MTLLMSTKIENFFTKGNEYNPEEFSYETDKKGNILLDENGDPVRDEGFVKKVFKKNNKNY